jgi:hypothetical protein
MLRVPGSVVPYRVLRPVQDGRGMSPCLPLPSCSSPVLQSLAGGRVPPYWLTIPSWPLPPLGRGAFKVFPCSLVGQRLVGHRPDPLMDFSPASGSTCAGPPYPGPPLVGFCAPTAYEVRGSDRHRACLTRLRCASRLSQPPDAFIPPCALATLFHAADAPGVHPSEVFPPDHPGWPLGAPAPRGVLRRWFLPPLALLLLLFPVSALPGDPFRRRGLAGQTQKTPEGLAGEVGGHPSTSSSSHLSSLTWTSPPGGPSCLAPRSRAGGALQRVNALASSGEELGCSLRKVIPK